MFAVPANEWGLVIDSIGADGTRPTQPNGTAVTPGNNTYGTAVSIIAGASLTSDAFGILINANTIGSNGNARDTLLDILINPSGGSSWGATPLITDLIVSCAAPYAGAGGIEYFFPLFIKAGTSIAVKASQNNASPTQCNCFVRLFCQPSHPELVKTGSLVRTYGSTPASSNGTAITIGTTSDGTFVQVGTIAAGDNPWFWQVGLGLNNTAVGATGMIHVDLAVGQAGAKKQPITNQRVFCNTNEQLGWTVPFDGEAIGASGELVYVRGQSTGGAQTGMSAVAYGVI